MVDTPRKTFPELQALTAPVVDSDVLAVYRAPGPAKRTPLSSISNYILGFFSAITGAGLIGTTSGRTVQDYLNSLPSLPQWQRVIAKIDNNNENVNFVLGGDSTGDATTEWYYRLAVQVAADYPTHTVLYRLWNDGAGTYDAAVTIQTGTGAQSVTFWNGSVAGQVASYFAMTRFASGIQTPDPDLIFTSYGHNGGDDAIRQLSFYNSLTDTLKTRLPIVPVILIGQNPTLTGETMAAKVNVFRDFAARMGWGFISVHDAFKQAGVPLADLMADNVHPNTAGQILWFQTVYASMLASRAQYGGGTITPSTMIRSWSLLADFNQWSKSNCTLSSETTSGFYETGGASTKVTTTSTASAGYLFLTAVSSDDAPAYANKYVTFSVWQRVPTGNVSGSGRVEIEDDAGTTTSTGAIKGAGFAVFTVTRKITSAPTFIKIYYYSADEAASPANVVYADRASLSLGLTPIDPLCAFETTTRYLRLFGSGAGGVGALYNASTSGTGLQVVTSAAAAPETGYAASFSADGLKVKAEANAYDRVAVGLSGVRFGSGSIATDMGIDRQLAGIMRFSGADLYPDTTGTKYIGGNGAEWRAIFLTDGLYINNNLILGPQGAAITSPTGGATIDAEARTAINAILARLRAGTPSIAT
jgi:lysophospholipase L1-like esterase